VLNFVVALTVVLGISILWVLLVNAGVPQGLEDIARRLALLDADASLVGNIEPLFSAIVSLAAVYMLTQTALATIAAFFYNLVSDLVGGIEVIVLEETYNDGVEQKNPTKPKEKDTQKETVLMSLVKTVKNLKPEKKEEPEVRIEYPSSDLPRPDVPRNIEEPTLMDTLKNTDNQEEDF
ncbi:MAG: DUF3566 domain-containing protein, partial [Actinomycetota bacterium]|nr:DUF3566 domain-containing protein [Actinomycetota bacterium]